MSGKGDKQEPSKSAGSKVLRKAKSFRDDLKNRISARRSPSISSKGSASGSETPPVTPVKSPTKKGILRGKSFSEGNKAEKAKKKSESDKELTDVERIDLESQKVFRSLRYVQDVVDKNILQLLPGSATVVLETIMEIHQLLSNYFINQESSMLMSTYNQVFQSLANLIRWSDYVYLHDETTLDRDNACGVIRAVNDGMNELITLVRDKLNNKNSYSSPKSPGAKSGGQESIKRNSLPDSLPLSPREREILERTSALSRSTEGILDDSISTAEILDDELPPPPKPPLPQGWDMLQTSREDEVFNDDDDSILDDPEDVPPPLPPKRLSSADKVQRDEAIGRSPRLSTEDIGSAQNPISITRTTTTETSVVDGEESSTTTSHTEITGDPSVRLQLTSDNSYAESIAVSDTSSDFMTNDGSTPSQSPHHSAVIKPQHLQLPGLLPSAGTPLSQSPTSSIGSMLSASSDDLLDDRNSYSGESSPTKLSVRSSTYDNFEGSKSLDSAVCDIAGLTEKICELTTHTGEGNEVNNSAKPPPLPDKERNKKIGPEMERGKNRALSPTFAQSQYDNIKSLPPLPTTKSEPINAAAASLLKQGDVSILRTSKSATAVTHGKFRATTTSAMIQRSMQVTMSRETFTSSETFSSGGDAACEDGLQKPPPIPLKKKHVETYMQILGQCDSPQALPELSRHSVHSINFYQTQWYQHQMEIFPPGGGPCPRSNTVSQMSDISSRSSDVFSVTSGSSSEESQQNALANIPPKLPTISPAEETKVVMRPKKNRLKSEDSVPPPLPARNKSSAYKHSDISPEQLPLPEKKIKHVSAELPAKPEEPKEKRSSAPVSSIAPSETTSSSSNRTNSPGPEIQRDDDSDFSELTTLDDVDVTDQLVWKKPKEDGPELRGGSVDSLIVHATTAGKNDFMYQEAFLTTYRTFISPSGLIEKLLYRYNRFSRMNDVKKKKLSRNAFSLLIRVVDELCTEVDEGVIQVLMDLVCQLLCDGELMLARALRKKVLEICEYHKKKVEASHHTTLLPSFQLTAKQHCLTDFRSQQVAEQMTLLDATLFQKIEIPEVLLWSKEQSEEHSPNLTKFTEHFNKMSYWCRTRVLEQDDAREREKYYMKFIKVMKHLRKYNNFNSYLAILSALDSAPVRRLEWQKQNLEALREFCELIDSSSAFRAYRQALAATEPPCIPYIGLILQDLTFVHIGNPDAFSDGNINFAKRWQQFNILDNMRRFKKCNYDFKKIPKIQAYFNNFDNALCEESLWHRSQMIKPKPQTQKKNLADSN